MQTKKLCQMHQQEAIFYDEKQESQFQYMCEKCAQSKLKIPSISEFKVLQTQIYNQVVNQISEYQSKLDKLGKYTFQLLQSLNRDLKNILDNIKQQTKVLKEKEFKFKNLFKRFTATTRFDVKIEQRNIIDYIEDQQILVQNQLINVQKSLKLDEIFQLFQIKYNNESNYKMNFQSVDSSFENSLSTKSNSSNSQQFTFQPLTQEVYNQSEWCGAIAFNSDASLMIAGCRESIKVFSFSDHKLIEKQKLTQHKEFVICLKFMKKSKQFLSADEDSKIIIWKQNGSGLWQLNQVLDQKKYTQIRCNFCILNENEDILHSNEGIWIWDKQINQWKKLDVLLSSSYSMCQNSSQNYMIECFVDIYRQGNIWISKKNGDKWDSFQSFKIKKPSYRMSFINDEQFVIQMIDCNKLFLYELDQESNQFKLKDEIQYQQNNEDGQNLFPIQFIKQIGLLLVKNNHFVNILRLDQYNKFKVDQQIYFGTFGIFGCISDDGKFLSTWDNKSKQIQIRKLIG